MGNQQVTEARIGWLAGIVDGEGSIMFGGTKRNDHHIYTPIVTICNTDPGMILEITKIYESFGIAFYIQHREGGSCTGNLGKKTLHQITVNRLSALSILLPLLIPSLITKRTKAVLMLQFVMKRLPKKLYGSNGSRRYTEDEIAVVESFRHPNDYTQGTSDVMI